MINQLTKLLFNKSNCPICNSKLNFNLSGIVQFASTKENDYDDFNIAKCNEHYNLGFAKFINTTTCFFNESIYTRNFFLLKEHKLDIIYNESIIEPEDQLIFQYKIDLCMTNYRARISDINVLYLAYQYKIYEDCMSTVIKMMENFQYPGSINNINKYIDRYIKLNDLYR